jgi:Trk K+ transport system NAD-binding subunit
MLAGEELLNQPQDSSPDAVLVCGLGRLGQHCALLLKELKVPVFGLQDVERKSWQIEGMPRLLDRFTIGDFRLHESLERAGIASCRAALFTTRDERANISAALAARSLNPGIRLIVRSSQTNLNERLKQRLGNLMTLDIAELPATAFSLAAIGDETVGLLSIDGEFLRVVEKRIAEQERWAAGRQLYDMNTRWRRVLHHSSAESRQPLDFGGYDPDERVGSGDTLAYVETYQPRPSEAGAASQERARWNAFTWSSIRARLTRIWTGSQTRRIAAITAAGLILLHTSGILLYKLQYPEVSLLDAFNVATVLIFDGYSNMFAQLKLPFRISFWMLLFSLAMTMSGAIVMGMVYAFITARVLSARLEFRRRSTRIPRGRHVVVIGMGPLGRRVAELLANLNRPVVGISEEDLDPGLIPRIPVLTGDPRECLKNANCATAASVLALTDSDVTNLELALTSVQLNESCRLVVRTDDAEFGSNMTSLAPSIQALSIYALSAEAFAAGALGENVLSLLRIGNETVLAIEFFVATGDTLDGRLITEVTCGYGLVAILYQRCPSEKAEFFPPEDIRLENGNRLVVLATIGGLQNAEHGVTAERTHQVRLLSALSDKAKFEGARIISRVTGCSLATASASVAALPGIIPHAFFQPQAKRLARELRVVGVDAEVLAARVGRVEPNAQSVDR